VKRSAALIGALAALMSAFTANAQVQAGAGACLAVADDLRVPVLVLVQDTNGVYPNGEMNGMQTHANGIQDMPWVIQPGGESELLITNSYGQQDYLKSQNGAFGISAGPMPPPGNPTQSVQIANGTTTGYASSLKLAWAFHAEMSENGNCNGAWVVTISG
jgi:hypothetical protein